MTTPLVILIALVAIAIVLLIILLSRNSGAKLLQIEAQLSSFEKNQERKPWESLTYS